MIRVPTSSRRSPARIQIRSATLPLAEPMTYPAATETGFAEILRSFY